MTQNIAPLGPILKGWLLHNAGDANAQKDGSGIFLKRRFRGLIGRY